MQPPNTARQRCCSTILHRSIGPLLAAILVLISTSALAKKNNALLVDQIAAVVGTEIILLSEVREKIAPMAAEMKAAGASQGDLMASSRIKELREKALESLIDESLVIREAREMELTVSTDEIDHAIQFNAKQQGFDMDALAAVLEQQGMTMAAYRNQVRSQLLRYKVLNLRVRGRIKITEAEARQYYNDQVREVRATGSFEGAHILLRVPQHARAADAAKVRKRAEDILSQVQAGEDFAALARQASEDRATSQNGGSLGLRSPGEIPPVLERVFTDLEDGEVAGPIRTPAGYHIVRLNSRQSLGVQPFAEVKDRILAQLSQEEMTRQEKIWLKELRRSAFIDIRMK
ncbi:MAG: peptidylprolyl isomerase [Myxococcota bacterium]|nr:peptidylprolyl isomerase [Myxococcota bacterium]